MITGFNTDVVYDGVTYHVQTEDKGLKTPLILSLVYEHGTILASKRSNYDDLLGDGFDEKVLAERLQKQHKLMCAAVQTGRLEDLKKMSRGEQAAHPSKTEAPPVKEPAPKSPQRSKESSPLEIPHQQPAPIQKVPPASLRQEQVTAREPAPKESKPGETVWDVPVIEDVEIIESDDFFEDGFVLSPDAIKIIDEFAVVEADLADELKIKLLGDYTFRAGEKKNISMLVCRGAHELEVKDAAITVKVLGQSFRPIIFHSKTDQHGVAAVFVKIPKFSSGRAAILVRAVTGGEETELRRVIQHQ